MLFIIKHFNKINMFIRISAKYHSFLITCVFPTAVFTKTTIFSFYVQTFYKRKQ